MNAFAVGVAIGAVAGLGGGWALYHQRPSPVETPAAAIIQKDGSTILERVPNAHATPKQTIPTGATVERVVRVTVQPKAEPAPIVDATSVRADSMNPAKLDSTGTNGAAVPRETSQPVVCPPVRVDLTLIRLADQTRRVIASSPDGAVVGGVDVPVESATPQQVLRWSVGPAYGGGDTRWGASLTRDLGPVRAILQVMQGPKSSRGVMMLAANIRF